MAARPRLVKQCDGRAWIWGVRGSTYRPGDGKTPAPARKFVSVLTLG